MADETGSSLDAAGSGVEPPIAPRVRQAFGLLERFAPALGARWAIELWCTPPAVEMSLRMPPGVPQGEPVEASWSGHRIAGESWGDGPAVYLVHGWGGCRAHLGVFVKPLVEAGHRVIAFDLPSHNDSDPGDLKPGRTTIVECAEAVNAFVRAHGPARAIVAHSLDGDGGNGGEAKNPRADGSSFGGNGGDGGNSGPAGGNGGNAVSPVSGTVATGGNGGNGGTGVPAANGGSGGDGGTGNTNGQDGQDG
jgi:hypothetical protein